jgi:DNA ligase-1
MKLFVRLFTELDGTSRTTEKVAALERYFRAAPPEDAAWALHFLIGRRTPRGITNGELRTLAAQSAGLPAWLVEEAYEAVGDLAETLALLVPGEPASDSPPLHVLIEERLLPLRNLPDSERDAMVRRTWGELNCTERLLWNKLITGGFRVGVARTLVARALARVAGVEPALMTHRLMGDWQPTAEHFGRLLAAPGKSDDLGQPYPFFLAHPLELPLEELGAVTDWQLEWKWDGIRAQLLKRQDQVLLWSRGEELITDQFPEIVEAAAPLPPGTVLDGEVLGWREPGPLPFAALQKRLGRKRVDARLRRDSPVAFMAYDLLELEGIDLRPRALRVRRRDLESLLAATPQSHGLLLSTTLEASCWDDVRKLRDEARNRAVEGLMLKQLAAPYGVGRVKGPWWKWKVDPYTVDAVLINAQAGHGRRAGLFTDYTFAVWHEGRLVPIAKAYSGLTDEEIKEVDAFIKANTIERFGPVRSVRAELVFELAFENIQPSPRHKSGIALRFPRINRWRRDKSIGEADELHALKSLLGDGSHSRPADQKVKSES